MKILVTGTSRSGTTFVHTTLHHLGISTTHEKIMPANGDGQAWPEGDHVEVSWCAPFHHPWDDITVLHLVRHPMRTIESFLGGAEKHFKHLQETRILRSMLPPPASSPGASPRAFHEQIVRDWCAWHYISWNRFVEQHVPHFRRYQLEDPFKLFQKIADILKEPMRGGTWTAKEWGAAAKKAKRNPSSHRKGLRIEEFSPPFRAPLLSIIKDYGYES